ncbi:hypothetical protein [Streptomyces sp. DSM 40484]|uniref:hypothetical protein n=1 Tax=Streptomyces kroppenstedtii TaxID=3051181 RepID=UPI0028D0D1B8|nr:hypothetical protein [Streptomyces sp. DSM 40484]
MPKSISLSMSGTRLLGRSVTAAVLVAATLSACGTEQGGRSQSAVPPTSYPTSYPPRPKCAQPAEDATAPPTARPSSSRPSADGERSQEQSGENEDRPPHYAENHAYRMQGSLSEGKRAQGEASAALIRRELEKVREEGGSGAYGVFDEQRIAAALKRLGCGKEHGVYIGNGFYSVHTGVVCVSGYVKKDELTSEVHGAYAEPQPGTGPCVENRGGH